MVQPAEKALTDLLYRLLAEGSEKEWLEFETNANMKVLGENISALANAAAECGREYAYLIYGVSDDLEVVGTDFKPYSAKVGGIELNHYLSMHLTPNLAFRFNDFIEEKSGRHMVILEIPAAASFPVEYEGERWIRVGSSKELVKEKSRARKAAVESPVPI